METKKQEAIRKAYGEQYDILKPFIDDNGWLKWSDECPINPVISDYDYNQALNSHRPKSLAGLETNNGWINIQLNKLILPTDGTEVHFYVVFENDNGIQEVYHKGIFNAALGFTSYYDSENYKANEVKCYQPIIKPLPPIY